jgi:hypothetical protein
MMNPELQKAGEAFARIDKACSILSGTRSEHEQLTADCQLVGSILKKHFEQPVLPPQPQPQPANP